MAREQLPTELVTRIVDTFESVLPKDVYLCLQGGELDVRQVGSPGGAGGLDIAGTPWPPMPAAVKWRLAVRDSYEWVARGISWMVYPGNPGVEDPMAQLHWPVEDAKVDVTIGRLAITAAFRDPTGKVVLELPPVSWVGTAFEPRLRRAPDEPAIRHYVGPVPDKARSKDASDDLKRSERTQARKQVMDELRRRYQGDDKERIRAELRAIYAEHPKAEPSKPGSKSEDFIVDMYAGVHGPHPTASTLTTLGKGAWHTFGAIRRLLREPGDG